MSIRCLRNFQLKFICNFNVNVRDCAIIFLLFVMLSFAIYRDIYNTRHEYIQINICSNYQYIVVL